MIIRTFVIAFFSRLIHCFPNIPLLCKYNYTSMILKQQIPSLGSKCEIHKVGALYFLLRNLSPKFNSTLMNIHLVALFHAYDLTKYGFQSMTWNQDSGDRWHWTANFYRESLWHTVSSQWRQLGNALNPWMLSVILWSILLPFVFVWKGSSPGYLQWGWPKGCFMWLLSLWKPLPWAGIRPTAFMAIWF